jgi:hypothetical protein
MGTTRRSTHAQYSSTARRQQVGFAGVELYVEDGEERGSAGVHPGQRHQIDEMPYAEQ